MGKSVYGYGGVFGHVTWITHCFPLPIDAIHGFPLPIHRHFIKNGFDWPSGFREEDV